VRYGIYGGMNVTKENATPRVNPEVALGIIRKCVGFVNPLGRKFTNPEIPTAKSRIIIVFIYYRSYLCRCIIKVYRKRIADM
jgi:hypothetical protein